MKTKNNREELATLRKECIEVEGREAERHWRKNKSSELAWICNIIQTIDRSDLTLDALCQKVTDVMVGYRNYYADIIGVRISIGDKEFKLSDRQKGNWKRSADIVVRGVKLGTLEIHCLTGRYGFDKEQSLTQLSFLTDFVAERIGRAIERIQILGEIQRREERFRALAEHTSDWVWEINAHCIMTYSNPKCKEILGYEPEEVCGETEWFFISPEYLKEYMNKMRSIVRSQKPFVQSENANVHKDGRLVILETSGVPFFDKFGRLLGYRGIDRDITSRKNLEKALRESEEFSSALLRTVPNPIIALNPDTCIRYVNPAFEKLVGYCSSEVVGTKPPYPWWTKETLSQINMQYKESVAREAKSTEHLFRKKDGETLWVETTLLPMTKKGVLEYYLESWIDITEQKRLRENMQFYAMAATNAEEEERKRIAHELHDETIQALFNLLLDIDTMMAKERQMSDSSVNELRQLKVKIDNIISETRRLSQELRPGLLDKFGLIPSIELLVEETQKISPVNCKIEIVGLRKRLPSDVELALYRVTQEALCNIRKHSAATEAIIRIAFCKEKAKLNIIDNGAGFKVPQMLGSFAYSGKLGLIGITERIRLLGGSVSIASEVGRGTKIIVEVPRSGVIATASFGS